jgi:hypothetical protein
MDISGLGRRSTRASVIRPFVVPSFIFLCSFNFSRFEAEVRKGGLVTFYVPLQDMAKPVHNIYSYGLSSSRMVYLSVKDALYCEQEDNRRPALIFGIFFIVLYIFIGLLVFRRLKPGTG